MFVNSSYLIFMLPAFILMMIAQWYVNSAFKRWSKIPNHSGLSGNEIAKRLISHEGLFDVSIADVSLGKAACEMLRPGQIRQRERYLSILFSFIDGMFAIQRTCPGLVVFICWIHSLRLLALPQLVATAPVPPCLTNV